MNEPMIRLDGSVRRFAEPMVEAAAQKRAPTQSPRTDERGPLRLRPASV